MAGKHNTLTKHEAYIIARFFYRMAEQIRNAWEESRYTSTERMQNAGALAEILGRLTFELFDRTALEMIEDRKS